MGIRIRSTLAGLAVLAVTACGAEPQNTPTDETGATATGAPVESAAPTDDTTASADPSDDASSDPNSDDSQDSGSTAQDADLADVDFNFDAQGAIDMSRDEVGDRIVHAIEVDWADDD